MYKKNIVFSLSSQALLSQAIQWLADWKLDFKDFVILHEEDNSIDGESYIGMHYKIVSNSIWGL
ncbi:hypothetical protein [Chryseobacterium culicis]|uniref:hypothetical protein n=1 Tax=Chryseobacterium culicis TaxID=680127 RepID=UPI00187598EE|nr:hypothetical protein [Chryseobacterium culicis]MBE4947339.1 hypothetical protein [Chryseobacterium culicis]